MPDRRYRVLFVASHPVQYQSPLFRRMAKHPLLDLHVAYCSLRGAESGYDPEFEATTKWDIPLLDGYSWTLTPNAGSGAEKFLGLRNPMLWPLIRRGNFDAVVCYLPYVRASFWICYLAARFSGAAFLFGTDAHSFESRDGSPWKARLKKIAWRRLFGLADQVFARSSRTHELLLSAGIPETRISPVSSVVDNEWWVEQSARISGPTVHASWGLPPGSAVILFCAKLQPWKRPFDVLEAFGKLNRDETALVFAGEGPLKAALERRASQMGLGARVRFLGFVNQSQLPTVYAASNVMVLPSEYEPFGLVVNEALCCGCPVIASDCVGATRDLIAPLREDFVYPCGDVEALTKVLTKAFARPTLLEELGRQGAAHMGTWSPERYVTETVSAIDKAVRGTDREAGMKSGAAHKRRKAQTEPQGPQE
jgi:glycosyltransferase involved in cell wall biosynthesis